MARRVLPAHAKRVMRRWDEMRYVELAAGFLRVGLIIMADHLFTNMAYAPSQPHDKPAMLQATIELPPHETVHLSLRVRKAFLRYQEHRPDAQRGWDLPPAVFVPVDAPFRRIYTSALLVDLATPDFSMPYNVIIMSSTLIALIFGSLFNTLIRRFVVVKLDEDVITSRQQ
jgi:phosphatidylinositol glycan class T